MRDERFRFVYRRFLDLYELPKFGGKIVGLLGMDIPHLSAGHIVAVDELGIVDPADGAEPHLEIAQYVLNRLAQGVRFHEEFLAVERKELAVRAKDNV